MTEVCYSFYIHLLFHSHLLCGGQEGYLPHFIKEYGSQERLGDDLNIQKHAGDGIKVWTAGTSWEITPTC